MRAVSENPWANPIDLDAFLDEHLVMLREQIPADRLRFVLVKAQVFWDWFEDDKRAWGFCLMQRAPDGFALFNLERLMERLPARDREVIELRADGLTDEEIAQRLRIAPATVRPLLKRARKQASVLREVYY
jgi:DNA-binding CsgD family transcriptional regulator